MADEERTERRQIACNYVEGTNIAAKGARAYVTLQLGGNLPERVRIVARSRGGRWIAKWEDLRRLDNFRLVTLPPEHPRGGDWRLFGDATQEHLDRILSARRELGMDG